METKLKAVNSKLNNAEDQTSDLEDIKMEITQSKQQTERHTHTHTHTHTHNQYIRPFG